jgi:lysozyme
MASGGDKKLWAGPRRPLAAALVVVLLVVVGLIHWNRPGLERFPVRGIDVSHHQGAIEWPRVAAANIHFAFIKASEGGDHLDTRFEENWREADKARVVRGAYHFFTFCTPGEVQADHYLDVVPPALDVLPPAVDIEFAGNCKAWTSVEDIRRELRVLLSRLEAAWGRPPVLYLTSESEERIVRGHFDEFPVWIRSVFFRPGGPNPTWLFWQYTDEGEIPGIETPVDLNVYRGERDELAALLR